MFGALARIAEVTTDLTTTSSCTINGQPASCSAATGAAAGIFGLIFFVFYLPIIIIMIASMWKIFTKAGKPGWAAIIPIYNIIVEFEIIGRPLWWLLLLFIPFVNIVIAFILVFDLAKSFGKGTGFGLLMLFLPIVGYPILAFSKDKYVGPAAAGGSATPPQAPSAPAAPQSPAQTPPQAPVDTPPQTPTPPAPPINPVQ